MSFENSRYMKSAREAEAEGGKDKLRARIEALEAELASLRSEREGMREGLKIATDTLAIMGEELAPVLPKTSTQANKVATRLRALLQQGGSE